MTRAAMDALDAWWEIGAAVNSPYGRDYTSAWNKAEADSRHYGLADHHRLPETILRAWGQSEIYTARPDVIDIVDALAAKVPHHPVLVGDEFPCDSGFVHLTRPHTVVDESGKRQRFHAIQWWVTALDIEDRQISNRSIALVAYTRVDDPDDDYSLALTAGRQEIRALGVDVPVWLIGGTRIYPADQVLHESLPEDQRLPVITTEDEWASPAGWLHRWALSFWAVLREQSLTVETAESPDRAARRRLERAGVWSVNPVRVVSLPARPRSSTGPGSGAPVNWSHRWIVGSHWRRQWYASTGIHRLRLIASHVKGPEDKPLVVKPRVFDVRAPREQT